MGNVGPFGIGILIVLVAVVGKMENEGSREERVVTRLLMATLHRIEDSMRGDHGSVEIRTFESRADGCAMRSPLLCRVSLDRDRLEITEHLCPRLYQRVLHEGGVTAIEATRIHELKGRINELENIIEPLGDPPPPPSPLCR